MTLTISRAAHDAMLAITAADPEREVCGLVLGAGTRIDTLVPVANVAADPARHFEIDPEALFAAHRAHRAGGEELLGYFHSHPNGLASPSPTDSAMAVPDNRLWLIAAGGVLTAWRASASGFVPVAYQLDTQPPLRQRDGDAMGPTRGCAPDDR